MDQKSGLSMNAYMFLIAFIFLYLAISFLGGSMTLSVIVAGGIVGMSYLLFNTALIKKVQSFKIKPKKTEPKVIEGEIVKSETNEVGRQD